MPAIAYVLDMYHRTNGAYGVNEVILASAMVAIIFPIFSVQPLTFVGVTGLINLVSGPRMVVVAIGLRSGYQWRTMTLGRLWASVGSTRAEAAWSTCLLALPLPQPRLCGLPVVTSGCDAR